MAFMGRHLSAGVKAAGVTGTLVLLVAIACHILCLATPFYFILEDNAVRAVLSRDNSKREANSLFSSGGEVHLPEWLVAPRVLSIVGLLLAATALVSLIAFVLTKPEKMPNLFLVTAAVTSIMGGIIILSSDISFAAEKTIAFYAYKPMDPYLFPKGITPEKEAYLIQQYDNHIISGWSFILDLISGALCIAIGPIFMFMVIRLQEAEDIEDKRRLDKLTPFSADSTKFTNL